MPVNGSIIGKMPLIDLLLSISFQVGSVGHLSRDQFWVSGFCHVSEQSEVEAYITESMCGYAQSGSSDIHTDQSTVDSWPYGLKHHKIQIPDIFLLSALQS